MVELAIGVTIFLTASLGAVQLGVSAVSAEGAQIAALVGARAASAVPISGDPSARLSEGQAAAVASLQDSDLQLAHLEDCTAVPRISVGCGLPDQCVEYDGGYPRAATLQACPSPTSGVPGLPSLGPSPDELDGRQNPACKSSDCFGSARSMASCDRTLAVGEIFVCLAYTSWPATAVDIWIRGTLRTLVPLASSAGIDAFPVSVQLRLQVESLTS